MMACAFQKCRLASFRHSRLYPPKEIAYYKPPAMRTAFLPGSGSWSPGVDRTFDRIAGYPRFVKVPANEEHGRELHLWIVSDDNGFQVLRFTDDFMEGKIAPEGPFPGLGRVNNVGQQQAGKRYVRLRIRFARLVTTMRAARSNQF